MIENKLIIFTHSKFVEIVMLLPFIISSCIREHLIIIINFLILYAILLHKINTLFEPYTILRDSILVLPLLFPKKYFKK